MTALTAAAYPIPSIPKRFRGFDDHSGGLDDRYGETAGLEFQFACGFGAHQRDDGVWATLHLDLCHDLVADHVGDQADKAIAG